MGKIVRAAVFGIFAAGMIASPVLSQEHASATPNDSARGLTWGVLDRDELPPDMVDVNCHGGPKVDARYAHNGSCNPYGGDTSCSVRLPLLCFKSDGSAPPEGVIGKDLSASWAGGQVAVTRPIAGTTLTSAESADAACSSALGTGWRMAEFHDGKKGWGFVARGELRNTSRFWVRIKNQAGNCWDSLSTRRAPEPARMTDSEVLSRVIEERLAKAKPAAAPPLTEANQALRRGLAAQGARLEARAKEWESVIRADLPKDSENDAAVRDALSQLKRQNANVQRALASTRIVQLNRCGSIEEAGNSALICDGQVHFVDTCGQPKQVRDLLVFQQQGGTLTGGDSMQAMIKAVQDCPDRPLR
jgi:hypothetical protein